MKIDDEPMTVEITVRSLDQLTAVYALLGGAAVFAPTHAPTPAPASLTAVTNDNLPAAIDDTAKPAAAAAAAAAAVDDGAPDIDAHGWPWDAEKHASTKGTTKEGLWRMKVGVSRPDPKPGFPKLENSSTGGTTTGDTGTAPQALDSATGQNAASSGEDDDEFAAFRAANTRIDDETAAAKANTPARKWTDIDLGSLSNQAAVKLGTPAPIKDLIGKYVPADSVAHSRNIPVDRREDFARALEELAGIEFAG